MKSSTHNLGTTRSRYTFRTKKQVVITDIKAVITYAPSYTGCIKI